MTLFSKGATYERISKADAGDEDGVIRQGEDTAGLARQRGIPLQDRRFRDNDKSATHGKHRPDYERLMSAVQRGEVDCIIVYMLGRLWRNRRERAEGMELLRKHEVSVLCVKGPELDLTTASGRLLAGLLGEVDTFEVEQMSEREQREMRQRVERGVPPTGPRCFGYTANGTGVVPSEAAEVEACFHALLAGASLSGMAAELNKRGVLNRNGRRWSHNGVRVMLLNERYAALREYRGAYYPGEWPPIVDEAVWRSAVAILTDGGRKTSPGPARKWLLSGLALCGVCLDGTKVTSAQRGYKDRPSERVYKCSGAVKHLQRKADPIDALIAGTDRQQPYGVVIQRLARPDAADLLLSEDVPDLKELQRKATSLRAKLDENQEDYDHDKKTRKQYLDSNERLRGKLEETEAQMTHPQRAFVLKGLIPGSRVEGEQQRADIVAKAWDTLPLDRRRAVVDTLMEITLLPGKAGRRPFDPTTVRIEWRQTDR
ncbi:recombinase family protein [Streptomyces scabiei]|uniref:recombinase family protein n=1 Tax=Streptomyces scabiei TaxID=1930 RepID=UPI0038F7155C